MVLLLNVWLMVPCAVLCALPPVNAPKGLITGALQVYCVPVGTVPLVPLAGVTLKAAPLHVLTVISLTAGFGFTVTVTVKVLPVHVPEVGVTV